VIYALFHLMICDVCFNFVLPIIFSFIIF